MFKKLEELEKKYDKNLSDPKIIANQSKFQECAKMHSDISKAVLKYKEYKKLADPKIIANQSKFQECAKMHSDISKAVLKYKEYKKLAEDPKIIANQSKFQECAKMHSDISKAVLKYKEYKKLAEEIDENSKLLPKEKDVEFIKLINEELEKLKGKKSNRAKRNYLPQRPSRQKKLYS